MIDILAEGDGEEAQVCQNRPALRVEILHRCDSDVSANAGGGENQLDGDGYCRGANYCEKQN